MGPISHGNGKFGLLIIIAPARYTSCNMIANHFADQVWTLTKKDLLLLARRRWLSTFIRAVAFPIILTVILASVKTWIKNDGGVLPKCHSICLRTDEIYHRQRRRYTHSHTILIRSVRYCRTDQTELRPRQQRPCWRRRALGHRHAINNGTKWQSQGSLGQHHSGTSRPMSVIVKRCDTLFWSDRVLVISSIQPWISLELHYLGS